MTGNSDKPVAAVAKGRSATLARARSTEPRSFRKVTADAAERLAEIADESGVIAGERSGAADEDMIGTRYAIFRVQLTGERTETPLDPVADHGVADLLGDREAHAGGRIAIATRADEQDEGRRRDALSAIGREEFGASPKASQRSHRKRRFRLPKERVVQAESLLRPRERRAARILRPPGVALRVRKPWRRLRTRLLGWKVRFMSLNPSGVLAPDHRQPAMQKAAE